MKPRMGVNKYGRDGLTYEGVGENKKWERMDTYGPKLVENIVQGTSRDILAEAMMRLKKAGFSIVFHVHDEAVLEVPESESSVEEVCRRKLYISTGNSRMEKKWSGQEMEFSVFLERLSHTVRTSETMEQYRKLSKAKQDSIKDVGGFVLGMLKGGRRKQMYYSVLV